MPSIATAVVEEPSIANVVAGETSFFSRSMADGPYRRGAEWHLIFATLWTIWNHRNEVVFRGRTPSVDVVVHEARGLVDRLIGCGLTVDGPTEGGQCKSRVAIHTKFNLTEGHPEGKGESP